MFAFTIAIILFLTTKVEAIENDYVRDQIEIDIHNEYHNGQRVNTGFTVSSPQIPGPSLTFNKPRGSSGEFMLNYNIEF